MERYQEELYLNAGSVKILGVGVPAGRVGRRLRSPKKCLSTPWPSEAEVM